MRGNRLGVLEARGIIDRGLESQAHNRAHAGYRHQSFANLIVPSDLRKMPIEQDVLAPHEIASVEKRLDGNAQLWLVLEQVRHLRGKRATVHLTEPTAICRHRRLRD